MHKTICKWLRRIGWLPKEREDRLWIAESSGLEQVGKRTDSTFDRQGTVVAASELTITIEWDD